MLLYPFTDFCFCVLKIPGVYIKDEANPAKAGLNFRHFSPPRISSLWAFSGLSGLGIISVIFS
jgi:hypothetical protein